MNRNRQKGFTLIELLIVVAIIGIIAAILIPNFLDALHKGRQKRTMGDIRQVANAYHSWATDNGGAAAAGQTTTTVAPGDFNGGTPNTVAEVQTELVPTYIRFVPQFDGWGSDIEYYLDFTDPGEINYEMMRSAGRPVDGTPVFDSSYTPGLFDPTDYEQDIVHVDGTFIRAPRGYKADS
ncbi:MAG TPA: prepilin-type N-terminal cleavage/methylation domain-containing protein [Thermoanaerobaculia bacterium]|nr:prepilin-type N-terminal cleavage/methylation domain-containing protein [Thermoanaerobaculia bacterium]